jgi:hypothetical protein
LSYERRFLVVLPAVMQVRDTIPQQHSVVRAFDSSPLTGLAATYLG